MSTDLTNLKCFDFGSFDLESFDNEMDDFFNGKDNLSGTNTRWIEKQVGILKLKANLTNNENKKLSEYYSELGKDKNGNKKGPVCWDYVKSGSCKHNKTIISEYGKTINGYWHPETNEREYLKSKNKS